MSVPAQASAQRVQGEILVAAPCQLRWLGGVEEVVAVWEEGVP